MKKTKSLYIAPLQESAGSVVVALGIMELLVHQMQRVAYFRPIIESSQKRDSDIELILGRYGLSMKYESCFGYTLQEAESMIAQGELHLLLETLLDRFGVLEREYDFVLIQGLSVTSFSSSLDFNLNLAIAKNIGAPVVSVLSGKDHNASQVVEVIQLENHAVMTEGCTHFATFVNRLDEMYRHQLMESVGGFSFPVFCLPEYPELDKPTMQEIATALNAKRLFGTDEDMNRLVLHPRIGAMHVEHFLEQLQDGDLIITSGDRSDILLGTLASAYAVEYPNASGILMTGGFEPNPYIFGMIQNIAGITLPIIATLDDTIETAIKVLAVKAKLNAKNSRKVALAIRHFESYVDSQRFMERIEVTESQTVTPMMFAYRLFERARASIKHIVLPESDDERILRATEIVLHRGAVKITLLGEEREILHRSATLGIDLRDVTILNWQHSPLKEEFATRFYQLRKEKGVTLEKAYDLMNHSSYFATMMVYCGYVDGMVSGAIHTTQETILPALQIIKTRPDVSLVSSVFFMCLQTKVLVYGDCAINPDPNAAELADIAIASADTAKSFGIEPKVAMLSYSTGTSGKGAEVEKVREATRLVKIARPDLKIDGPIQYDAAVDSVVAAQKLPNSQVAGEANVLIFPDLNTGNNTYKAVQRSSNAVAIGPILQGLNRPVNDLSRGCLVEDIVNTIVITAIQAQKESK